MSDTQDSGSEHADEYREETVWPDDAGAVQVEEYPGGDMAITLSGGEQLYFTSGQAAALRTCLGRIDGGKRRDVDTDNQQTAPENGS